jgi:hypothetical protein
VSPLTETEREPLTARRARRPVPRIALSKEEAAEALGMSVRSLDKYVLPDVKVIRRGMLVLIPVKQLDAWADRTADYTL